MKIIRSIKCCCSQFLVLCGAAYRPTEEIDLRSIGWGNIFQLPFKHLRDYRLRLLCPFFIYSGFETLFAVTGFSLVLCYFSSYFFRLYFVTEDTWAPKHLF